ncbi:MAG: MinD/ParA family protein [Thiohalomonadaceae bacterium]
MQRPIEEARVLAVTSGKGGVGKTNVALNLAIALANRMQRVVLWDADLGLANVQVLLRLQPQGDLSDVLAERKSIREVLIDTPVGIKVVPGASGDEHLANLSVRERLVFSEAIQDLVQEADFIIIDTGAGISANTMDFARAADDVLVVTTPEPTALVDAYAAIKVVHGRAPWSKVHLVVNMARDEKEAKRAMLRLESMAAHYVGRRLIEEGTILYDQAVGSAVRQRQPFILAYPESQAAAAIWRMADSLLKTRNLPKEERPEEEARPGVLQRLLTLIAE